MTHASDADIDNERAKVVNDLWLTGCVNAASMLRRDRLRVQDSPGSPINTDGSVAVLKLNSCDSPSPTSMAGNKPPVIRKYPLSKMFVAIGNDLARSNPVTLGYTFDEVDFQGCFVEGTRSFRGQSIRGVRSNNAMLEGTAVWRWKRPSITDPEMADSPTLNAGNVH